MVGQAYKNGRVALRKRSRGPFQTGGGRIGAFKKARPNYQNRRTGGFAGLEVKFYDSQVDPTALTADWATSNIDPTDEQCLNALTQGTDEDQRIGRKATFKSVMIKGEIRLLNRDGVATLEGGRNTVRIILVLDTQTNGAGMLGSAVMNGAPGNVQPENAYRNLENSKRFKILADKTITLRYQGIGGDGTTIDIQGETKTFSIFKSLNLDTNYSASQDPPDIADIVDNSLHLIAVADSGAQVFMNYMARTRFVG